MKRNLAKILTITIIIALIGTQLGGCFMNKSIKNAAQAKEYILNGLEKKYGEKFATDMEVETQTSGAEDQFIHEYLLKEVYPVTDPTKKFAAYCTPYGGGVVDMRGEVIFQEDAEEFVSSTFGDDTQLLASYNVKIIMYGTTTVWREGASFEEFLDAGVIPPQLTIRLYVVAGASTEECASQVFACYQAMNDSGTPYEMKACYEGEDADMYPFFMWNSTANPGSVKDVERMQEKIEYGIKYNENKKKQYEGDTQG